MTAPLPSDLEIAHAATLRPLAEVAADLGLSEVHLEPWGRDVAKIDLAVLDEPDPGRRAKYVVVTAITPTPLGEAPSVRRWDATHLADEAIPLCGRRHRSCIEV